MFNDAPMTQSVSPIGHPNQKLVFPDTVIGTYRPLYINAEDPEPIAMMGMATQVEGFINPCGLNVFTSPDVDYYNQNNNWLGQICMATGNRTIMLIA